ncbi:MAG: M48 family metalloprotease [Cyanobacteria bacterium J06626_4]
MNQVKTIALLGLLSALLINIGYWVVGGTWGLLVGLGVAAALNFAVWYRSDGIALGVYAAQPITLEQALRIQPMVRQLCDRACLPMPEIYVIPSPAMNAFATGRDPEHGAIALSAGLLNQLTDAELEGVIAHELSHIRHRDTLTQTIAATLAGAISQGARWSRATTGERHRALPPLALIATWLLAPLAATLLQLALSRSREFAADQGAAQLTGNPQGLVAALQRLQNSRANVGKNVAFAPLLIVSPWSNQAELGSGWRHLFSTHPSTADRIERLRGESSTTTAGNAAKSRWAVQSRDLLVTALLVGGLVGAIAIPARAMQQQRQITAQITVINDRLSSAADKTTQLQTVDREEWPQLIYRVKLAQAPLGRRLALSCRWINPTGQVKHRNRYRTKKIDNVIWNTWCRHTVSAQAQPGRWTVQMQLGDRPLSTKSFAVN